MKSFYVLILSFVCFVTAEAQCGDRYHNFIFTDSLISDINYGQNTNVLGLTQQLDLDIYLPAGDTETSRPLLIMAHGGGFIAGSKTGNDVVPLCQDLAKMGYVVASISYRLGINNLPSPGPDSTDAAESVIRASHDAKAAVRFFRKSFQNGNPYGIDTSLVFFSGVSAGGFMALNVAYFNEISEYPTFIDSIGQPGLTGGIEGESGNPGYPSHVKAVINICGALRDTSWMSVGDAPVLNLHGDMDATVPYASDLITLAGIIPLLEVDGSFSIAARADHLGILNCFETHEGEDHVPHTSNTAYYDTTLNLMRNFLAHFVCNEPINCNYGPAITVVNGIQLVEGLIANVYPNPTSDAINIVLPTTGKASMILTDLNGKHVFEKTIFNKSNRVSLPKLDTGYYLLQIIQDGKSFQGRLIIE